VQLARGLDLPRYDDVGGAHPPLQSPAYASTLLRAPRLAPVPLPQGLTEVTGPLLGEGRVTDADADLTRQSDGDPIGQRIVVQGRVLDGDGRPVPRTLVEIWQANAAGRYRHDRDQWPAPLDPHFAGAGRTLTDEQGRYRFTTVRPGAYPWGNHHNAWRPAHIHFSLFGTGFAQRLITQMYFEGDPLIPKDSILNTIPDPAARQRLVALLDLNAAVPLDSLAYRFDIVLRGTRSTLFENKLHGN